ncbi:Cilia- and flagella-associated protein 100 [Gonapodya sp. JEL0774]|nr:Cilia- and flagella-associated protein 100 [Gonapodya sp. JEL0774]
MFLLQHSLEVKRGEMRKLDEVARAEERKLLEDERALEEDAARFDAFLKENDRNSVEAIKKAEAETKLKLDRVSEIKRLSLQLVSARSDMSKCSDQLRDLKRYRDFLESVAPPEWRREHVVDSKKKSPGGDGSIRPGSAMKEGAKGQGKHLAVMILVSAANTDLFSCSSQTLTPSRPDHISPSLHILRPVPRQKIRNSTPPMPTKIF